MIQIQDLNIIVSCTLMSQKIAEPIEFILKSEIGGVLSKAFAQLYRTKPHFPVTHLANWLKQYSQAQHNKKQKQETVIKNLQQHDRLQSEINKRHQQQSSKKTKIQQSLMSSQKEFNDKISQTQYLEDLLEKWLPNFVERRYGFSGCYVGCLTHPYRHVEPGNFQVGAEVDAESAKVIQYIGTSDSQQNIMKMKILPSQNGVSFECFNQPQPEPEEEPVEGQDPKPPKQPKKTYVFVPDVTKNQKVFYFKFPRLGSYACFPMKLKSVLIQSAFDQGIVDYKEYVKQKQEAEKQYNQKHNEIKNEYEEAKKKYEQFQVPQEQPTPQQIQQKKTLQAEVTRLHDALTQFQKTPPQVPQPKFNSLQKCYMLGCDTLGQDKQIPQSTLDQIDKKTTYFRRQFENKQKNMLLHDILTYIEQQSKLDALELLYRDHEKKATAESEEQAKQKNLKDKELEYEIAATKVKRMDAFFEQPNVEKSMNTYFHYNTAKYKQILQIALMFLGYKAKDINLSRKNVLDFRKVKQPQFVQEFMKKLVQFDVRPAKADPCPDEYKINKILQRLQKIDLEQVAKYNGFIWALANHIKSYCWALMLCRDAKKQAYEISLKNKEDRNAQIQKYTEQRLKAMNAAKAELGEQNQGNFNQQQWISTYIVQNPEPQPLQAITLQQYHNID